MLASLETGVTPTEEVALKIYQELKTKLSEEEIDTFIQSVYERKQPIQSLKELDYLLGDIKGLQTDFFENNSTSFTELYFYLEKPIVINELEIADQLVYYSFDHYYLPLKLVVEQYGYSYKQISNDELYITNRTDTYRFYRNKQIFYLMKRNTGFDR